MPFPPHAPSIYFESDDISRFVEVLSDKLRADRRLRPSLDKLVGNQWYEFETEVRRFIRCTLFLSETPTVDLPMRPVDLPGDYVEELVVGPLVFRHEPSLTVGQGEIAGHLHPAARIVRRGCSVRRPCFVSDGDRLIMPAFGAYTGSLNVLDNAFHGLFVEQTLRA